MLQAQCHRPSPNHHHCFMGGMNHPQRQVYGIGCPTWSYQIRLLLSFNNIFMIMKLLISCNNHYYVHWTFLNYNMLAKLKVSLSGNVEVQGLEKDCAVEGNYPLVFSNMASWTITHLRWENHWAGKIIELGKFPASHVWLSERICCTLFPVRKVKPSGLVWKQCATPKFPIYLMLDHGVPYQQFPELAVYSMFGEIHIILLAIDPVEYTITFQSNPPLFLSITLSIDMIFPLWLDIFYDSIISTN